MSLLPARWGKSSRLETGGEKVEATLNVSVYHCAYVRILIYHFEYVYILILRYFKRVYTKISKVFLFFKYIIIIS
jgi:hypothetical protein